MAANGVTDKDLAFLLRFCSLYTSLDACGRSAVIGALQGMELQKRIDQAERGCDDTATAPA